MERFDGNSPKDSPAVSWLDQVQMSEVKREAAKQQMRRAEAVIDLAFGMASRMRATGLRWKDAIFPPAHRRIEAYLAKAVDHVDLEQRMRDLDRRPAAFLDRR